MICHRFLEELPENGTTYEYRVVWKARTGVCGKGPMRFTPTHEHPLIAWIDEVRAGLAIQPMISVVRAVGQAATHAFARLDDRYGERRGTAAHQLYGTGRAAETATHDGDASHASRFHLGRSPP